VGPGHCVDGLVLYAGAVGPSLLVIHEIWGPKFGIQLGKGCKNLESRVEGGGQLGSNLLFRLS
jgi:hypothetical protein